MKKIHSGLEIFNGKHNRFGGHWQFMSKITNLEYFIIGLSKWEFSFENEEYEGSHYWMTIGFIRIMWGKK